MPAFFADPGRAVVRLNTPLTFGIGYADAIAKALIVSPAMPAADAVHAPAPFSLRNRAVLP